MARLAFGAFKLGHPHADGITESLGGGVTASADATNPFSGAGVSRRHAWSGGTPTTASYIAATLTPADGRTYFWRFVVRVDALPTADMGLVVPIGTSVGSISPLVLGSDGKLKLPGGTVVGSITPGQWAVIGVSSAWDGTAATLGFRVDGGPIVTATGARQVDTVRVGVVANFSNASATNAVNFESWAINDDTGASDNSWVGTSERCLLLPPVADVTRGDWTAGGGGTSNLWDAIDNVPPVGVNAATNTSQVRDNVSTATDPAASYDFHVKSYTEGGVPAGASIRFVQPLAEIGDSSSTLAVTVGLSAVSNPAIAESTADTPSFAAGTYPSQWVVLRGPLTTTPTVTRATRPVLRLSKRTAAATIAYACAAGVYVAFEPAPPSVPISIGEATETDTAQTLTRAKTKATGEAVETDTAQHVNAAKARTIGQALETGIARSAARLKGRLLGLARENNLARPISAPGSPWVDLPTSLTLRARLTSLLLGGRSTTLGHGSHGTTMSTGGHATQMSAAGHDTTLAASDHPTTATVADHDKTLSIDG